MASPPTEPDGGAERTGLPVARVRVSARARRVRLVMSASEGLTVVVPRGFDQRRVPGILDEKRRWIERTWRRLEGGRRDSGEWPPRLPSVIALPAMGEEWRVEYRRGPSAGVSARSSPSTAELVLRGAVDDTEACRAALIRWLSRRARAGLSERLDGLAHEHALSYRRLSIRHQRSRWGSCSRHGTISLNARLLFLAPDLVDYVLLHELCHTLEMNHSPRFWRAVEARMPGCARYRARLRRARDHMPSWLDHPVPSALP